MSKQLDKLTAAKIQLEEQQARLMQKLKEANQKISAEKRKERNAHIYRRGGELTMHLGDNTELFTDEDVALLLNHVFSLSDIQHVVKQMQEIRRGEKQGTVEEMFEEKKIILGEFEFGSDFDEVDEAN